ncbi:MAG TPA: hypothetical protein VN181_12375 [Thermoanaerobaculia bacterium]|nr:hypothetical protein [Thermoanaerobaculia bacterium]
MTADEYLDELRARLRGVPDAEDIVAEIRGHVHDAGPDVQATLARLGTPSELAALYATERSNSPALLFRSLFRFATVSIGGFFALLGLAAGYVLAISFFLAAIIKPFAQHRTGVWRLADGEISLRLGLLSAPPAGSEELLGWWIVPIGLLAGALVLWLTPRFGRWATRRFRRSLVTS